MLIAVTSTLSANEFVSNEEVKQMEALEKVSIQRQKQQAQFDYMEHSEYEAIELLAKAQKDFDDAQDKIKNLDYYVNLNTIAEHEKKLKKMKASKSAVHLTKKIEQLEKFINEKKKNSNQTKGVNNE